MQLRRFIVDVTPLRLDPAFRRLWIGITGSAGGKEAARLAIPLQAYLLTGSAASIAVVALAQLLATILFSLGGGALADAYDRRLVLFGSQAGMALVSGAMLITALIPGVPFPVIVLLAFLLAGLFAMENPARIAAVPRVVPPERITAALALTSLNYQVSSVVGPAAAGILIAIGGLPAAFALQALAYAWAAYHAWRLPQLLTGGTSRPTLGTIADGLRFVRSSRLIKSAFGIDLVAMVFGLPLALIPVLAIDVLGVGAAGAATLASVRGAGALLAALTSGWLPRVRLPGRAVIWSILLFSFASTLLGLSGTSYPLALIAMAVCGATDVVSAVLRNAIVQTAAPDDFRGRVTAVHVLVAAGGPRVGDARAALMAEVMGIGNSLAAGGLLAIGGLVLVARAVPEFRNYRILGRAPGPPAVAPASPTETD